MSKPRKDDPQMLATLYAWNRAMSQELGMEQDVDEDVTDMYLALTGAAASEVVRPAAPFAAMFAGWLYGSGHADSLEEAAVEVRRALRETAPEQDADGPEGQNA